MLTKYVPYQILWLWLCWIGCSNLVHAAHPPLGDTSILLIKKNISAARNQSDVQAMKKSILELDRLKKSQPNQAPWADYYIAYVLLLQNHYIQDSAQSLAMIDSAITLLKPLTHPSIEASEKYILLAALSNVKMGQYKNDWQALIQLNKEKDGYLFRAWATDKKNPRYFLVKGESAYYTPKDYGGGKELAESYFKTGIALFDSVSTSDPILPDWGYLDLLFWLAYLEEEKENYPKAIEYYEKLLTAAPEMRYVRDEAIPKLRKKLSKATLTNPAPNKDH